MGDLAKYLRRWLPVGLWMAAIFLMSAQPKTNLASFGAWDLFVKKAAHFLAYAVLAFLVRRTGVGGERPFLWSLLILFLYAVSDEVHQTFVPGRHGTGVDVLIDMMGGLTVLGYGRFKTRLGRLGLRKFQWGQRASSGLP